MAGLLRTQEGVCWHVAVLLAHDNECQVKQLSRLDTNSLLTQEHAYQCCRLMK